MLLRRRLFHSTLALSATALAFSGCARDLETDPPVDPSGVVTAQFDPTNPIPVFQVLPTPTLLAQDPATGVLLPDPDRPGQKLAEPEACELPTTTQCLAFVDGFPTTAPITVAFSGQIDESSIQDGIRLWEVGAGGALTEVEFTAVAGNKPPINEACFMVYNTTADDAPPGIVVQLQPSAPLKPATQYVVTVESHEGASLRAADGELVEPSSLFFLMNVGDDEPDPVLEDGTIVSALLRSQVQGTVAAALFPNRPTEDLTDEERMQLAAAVQATGGDLYRLYQFFDGVIDLAVANGAVADRKNLILTNTWITGRDPTTVAFDPANAIVPFPNSQLLTNGPLDDPTMLQVNLPVDPEASPTQQALVGGLNTLNGFSTLAPMVVQFTRNVDPATLDGNVGLHLVQNGMLNPDSHPIAVTTSSAAEGQLATVRIQPLAPLQDNAHYVAVITRGVLDTAGVEVEPQSTFDLLKTPVPLVDDMMNVLPDVVPALQCSFVGTAGRLGNDTEVAGLAQTIEADAGLRHQRWLTALNLLQAEPVNLAPDDILFAWSYNTQDITALMTQVRDQLIPAWDTAAPGPRLVGPVTSIVGTSSIAGLVNVVGNLCVPLCQAGQTGIDPAQCGSAAMPNPALPAEPFCQLAINLIAGNLERADLYLMRSYRATAGSPYTAGTFTPETLMTPDIENIQVWVIQGSGQAPAAGRPAAILQHGLGQVKESMFLSADRFATANGNGGWAAVLMDLPFHGSRASDLTQVVEGPLGPTEAPCTDMNGVPNVDPGDVMCDPLTGMCAGGCDGVQDSSGTGFISSNVFGARDNFRQGLIDHLTLIYTLQQETQAGGALEGVIDATQIGYLGQSLGGITGGNLMAFAPDAVESGVLNVAGGGLVDILLNTVPQISAGLFIALNQAGVCEFVVPNDPTSGCVDTPAFQQFLLTAQWALDPGDPLATSIAVPGAVGNQNVMIQMAQPDAVVNNDSTRALAGSYGFLTNDPLLDHLQVYDFRMSQAGAQGGCHGFLLAPITEGGFCGQCLEEAICNSIGSQTQAASFIEQGGGAVPDRPSRVGGIIACDDPCGG